MTKLLYIPAGAYVRFISDEEPAFLTEIIEKSHHYFKDSQNIILEYAINPAFNLHIENYEEEWHIRSETEFEFIYD